MGFGHQQRKPLQPLHLLLQHGQGLALERCRLEERDGRLALQSQERLEQSMSNVMLKVKPS